MRVRVNGEATDIDDGLNLAGMLRRLGLDRRRIAVEHNRRVVRPRDYARTRLADGDVLEIVTFAGEG